MYENPQADYSTAVIADFMHSHIVEPEIAVTPACAVDRLGNISVKDFFSGVQETRVNPGLISIFNPAIW